MKQNVNLLATVLALVVFFLVNPVRADEAKFKLTSPAFTDGGRLPVEFTCDGKSASPPLEWTNAPASTRSFAVTMHHIPGPDDKHVYLVIYHIPATVHALGSNAIDVGVYGVNSINDKPQYMPPCSKGPGPKTYILTVYALSGSPVFTSSAPIVTMDLLLKAIKDKTLATATMNVTYERSGQSSDDGWVSAGPPGPGADHGDAGRTTNSEPAPNGQPPIDRSKPLPPEMQLLNRLNLSDEQKLKLKPILDDFRQKQEKLRLELLSQMRSVLNNEQMKTVEETLKHPGPSTGGSPATPGSAGSGQAAAPAGGGG